jgi:hypothetical protein
MVGKLARVSENGCSDACIGGVNVRVFVLRSEFLALLLVHVYGDGKAFPESGIADACHFRCDVRVWLVICVLLVLFVGFVC